MRKKHKSRPHGHYCKVCGEDYLPDRVGVAGIF